MNWTLATHSNVQIPCFWKFLKYPDIWGISQISSHLGNLQNLFTNQKFPWNLAKELSLCNKSQFSNTYISTSKLCKPLIFQLLIVWYNTSHSLKYLRSATICSKDIVIIKSEFVAKTQFLSMEISGWYIPKIL